MASLKDNERWWRIIDNNNVDDLRDLPVRIAAADEEVIGFCEFEDRASIDIFGGNLAAQLIKEGFLKLKDQIRDRYALTEAEANQAIELSRDSVSALFYNVE